MKLIYHLFLLTLPCWSLAQEARVGITPRGGFLARSAGAVLHHEGPGDIRYTLDGSTPGRNAPIYAGGSIPIERTTTLRAVVTDGEGRPLGPVTGASYLIDEPPTELLTLSVAIDHWRLFDPVRGWYLAGPGADPGHWKQPGANWWTRREHPAHLEIIEPGGRSVFAGTTGFRMFGGMSRLEPQKSFSLSVRGQYGERKIDYPLFGEAGNDDFRFLVARNGGSDWGRSYLRDALLTGLLRDESWDLERQAARPVQVYLNGRYWGIYHLREKINARFLADRFAAVHPDSLDLLEHRGTVKRGSGRAYQKFLGDLASRDPARSADMRQLQRQIDTDNYMRLQIAQTYFDNRDAGGNIRYWRPHGPDGRFRWVLYDVDQGFGLHREGAAATNTIEFYTDPTGPTWPNPPWSTLLQRKLLRNADYRRDFVNRSLDYLQTDFATPTVLAQIDERVAALEHDMPRHLARWQRKDKFWRLHLERLRTFARERPAHLREHLRELADGGPDEQLSVGATAGGHLLLNGNLRIRDRYVGRYFSRLPVRVAAVPERGYRFAGWAGTDDTAPELDLRLDRPRALTARFEPLRHELADRVIINEVCPRGGGSGDWVELYNRGDRTADLRDWILADGSGQEFRLPAVQLDPGDYLVACRRVEKFRRRFPGTHNVVGGLPFGLNRRADRLGLYSRRGAYVNEVSWTTEARDSAFTLALVLPGLDNTLAENWVVEEGAGTPNLPNPTHLVTAVIDRQDYWLRIGVGLSVLLLIGVWRVRRVRE